MKFFGNILIKLSHELTSELLGRKILKKFVPWVLLVIISISVSVNVYLGFAYIQLQNDSDDLINDLFLERSELMNERDDLKSEIETLVIERDDAEAEVESFIGLNRGLIDENYNLMGERDDLKNEIYILTIERDNARAAETNLLTELDLLKMPNIITINLEASDHRNPTLVHQFQFSCDLINVGGSNARNVKIDVEAHDALGVLVINTTAFEVFSMDPGSHVYAWVNINYEGQPLSDWNITTVWD